MTESVTMATIQTPDGRLVTMPSIDLRLTLAIAEQHDCLVFWAGGGTNNGWLPLLLPRRLYRHEPSRSDLA